MCFRALIYREGTFKRAAKRNLIIMGLISGRTIPICYNKADTALESDPTCSASPADCPAFRAVEERSDRNTQSNTSPVYRSDMGLRTFHRTQAQVRRSVNWRTRYPIRNQTASALLWPWF